MKMEIITKIDYKYLMNKTKSELAYMVLDLLNNEPTEREKKLINYIIYLFGVINAFEFFFTYIRKSEEWLNERFKTMDIRKNQDEMIDFLKDEFNIPINKKTMAEVIGEKEKQDE